MTTVKDYTRSCEYCLVSWDSLPTDFSHCQGCHETFSDSDLAKLHIHKLTGGCRFPGNLERFYEVNGVWYQKPDPNANTKEE